MIVMPSNRSSITSYLSQKPTWNGITDHHKKVISNEKVGLCKVGRLATWR
jgi:hypothetical protein